MVEADLESFTFYIFRQEELDHQSDSLSFSYMVRPEDRTALGVDGNDMSFSYMARQGEYKYHLNPSDGKRHRRHQDDRRSPSLATDSTSISSTSSGSLGGLLAREGMLVDRRRVRFEVSSNAGKKGQLPAARRVAPPPPPPSAAAAERWPGLFACIALPCRQCNVVEPKKGVVDRRRGNMDRSRSCVDRPAGRRVYAQ